MLKLEIHKVLFLIFICLFIPATGAVAWNGMDDMEAQLFEKINQARISPHLILNEPGIDRQAVLECHPYLSDYMDTGFSKLEPDERLFLSATRHAEEMAAHGYFSKISLDGSEPSQRLLQCLYYPLKSGEVLGVVLFQRYLSRDNAINALYKNMIQNDLDCKKGSETIIFNPEFKEIGLSIKSGFIIVNGRRLNFYLAVADFGTDGVSHIEKQILIELNRARTTPDQYQTDAVLTGENDERLEWESLASASFDPDLYLKAKKSLEDFIQEITRFSLSEAAPDDQTPNDQNSDLPEVLSVGTSKIWITVDEKTPEEAGTYLLGKAIRNEVSLQPDERVLLNPEYSEVGIAFASAPFVFNDEDEYFVHAMVIESGLTPDTVGTYELSGVIYTDKDKDGEYAPEEGYTSAPLMVSSEKGDVSIYTGELGEFSLQLEPGEYVLKNKDSQNEPGLIELGLIEYKFTITDHNVFILYEVEKADTLP